MIKPIEKNWQNTLKDMASHLAVIATDMTGKIVAFNHGAEQLSGFTHEEIMNHPMPVLDFEKMISSLQNNSHSVVQAKLKHKNGEIIPLAWDVSVIEENNGTLNSAYLFIAIPNNADQAPDFTLSQMHNSEVFMRVLEREFLRMKRQQESLAVINIDVDGFQSYEKQYGKEAANDCLTQIGAVLNTRVQRAGDFIAYMGGDEFMILLPNTDRSGAVKMAEYARLSIAGLEIKHQGNSTGIVTISLGIAHKIPDQDTQGRDFIDLAATQLQQAKSDGRNCSRIETK